MSTEQDPLLVVASAVRAVGDTFQKWAQRFTVLLAVMLMAFAAVSIVLANRVGDVAARVDGIAARIESGQRQLDSLSDVTTEAASQAKAVADSAPVFEVVPATTASAGAAAKPSTIRVIVPARVQHTASPAAPSASVILPLALSPVPSSPLTSVSPSSSPMSPPVADAP